MKSGFSDLDLVIYGMKPISKEKLLDAEEAFEESDLPIKVDLLDYQSLSKSFQAIIDRDHVILKPGKEIS
ncbi:MAG: nucleotidyltransferase domain-containing protein [Candidatus Caenarcaniphilales bacterium]|nr:nucleotidyltransferase domain-containing protein [Candidatus Caenarcaniphilales bacterium]